MALTKAQAKSLSILEVSRSLGMEMERNSHKEYYWKEHDSSRSILIKILGTGILEGLMAIPLTWYRKSDRLVM
ncbi:hypothetical protein [Streptococcus agalactiae]|uniref:hypothetical protein n=1 Tax=Streptococcus agalactiae TaxID=1311 RepID=UPI0026A5C6CD